ncbi:MAG: hypothetical protein GYB65_05580 [Chloroflexi bacterium]|nr:hypothetical protein [Chloroflexota bacterium]
MTDKPNTPQNAEQEPKNKKPDSAEGKPASVSNPAADASANPSSAKSSGGKQAAADREKKRSVKRAEKTSEKASEKQADKTARDAATGAADEAHDEAEQDGGEDRSWYFWPMIGAIVMFAAPVLVLLLALLLTIFNKPNNLADWVSIFRDLFIILLAVEGMLIGVALIVLILQLAALVNLLQNEITPIVDNLNQASSTVRGTAEFMSQNVVEPVVKIGAVMAATGGIVRELLGVRRAIKGASRSNKKALKE